MHKNVLKTRQLSYIALCAVLMAICSWISIPTAVPFTMQTFAVFFALDFLGAKQGTVSILIYLMLGIIGIPVFSNFTAGIGVILGPNGGYMIGWLAAGLVMGLAEKLPITAIWKNRCGMLLGLAMCYLIGTVWFIAAYARTSGNMGLWTALCLCVFPFVLPDCMKLTLALWLSRRLKKIVL